MLISLSSGVLLGFLFSFLFVYNDNISPRNNFIEDLSYEATDVNVELKTGNLADYLYNEVRVLCIVMTDSNAIEYRTQYLKETWVKRCNKVIYIGSETSEYWRYFD